MNKKTIINAKLKQIGKKYLDNQKYNLAINYLMDYLNEVPNDIDTLNWLGQIFKAKNEFEKAKYYFNKVLLINPKDEVALYGLADILKEEGRYSDSMNLAKGLLSLNENNARAHYILGAIYSLQNNYKQAEGEYKLALKIMPDNIYVYQGLIEVLTKQGKFDECIQTAERALEIDKSAIKFIKTIISGLLDKEKYREAERLMQSFFSSSHLTDLLKGDHDNVTLIKHLADLYNQKGLYKKAVVMYKKLNNIMPDDIDLLRCQAEVYRKLGKDVSAINKYKKILNIYPNDIKIMETLTSLYKDCERYACAENICKNILKIDTNNRVALDCLSSIYNERKNYKNASVIYKRILDIYPDNIKALVSLGHIYRDKKQYRKAISCYRRAIEIDKSSYEAHCGIGKILLDNNKFLEAEEEFKEALRYNPNDVNSLEGIGCIYKQYNRDEEAKEVYLRCKQINPYSVGTYFGLGIIFLKQRKFDEAIGEFNKALEIAPSQYEIKKELGWAIREKKRCELAYVSSCEDSISLTKEEIRKVTRPRFCALSVVRRCNFKCKMCHIWENKDNKELNIQQWKDFISSFKRVADDHCQINFAGGEPFLKEGIIELINFAYKQGFITAVCTNAYFIDEAMAIKIGESGLRTIAISLDTLDEKKHDFLRGVKGSYARVMNAIELLNKHAPRTELNLLTIILQISLDELIPLARWVQANDNINMINFLGLIQPRGNDKDEEWYAKSENKILWPQDINILNEALDSLIKMKNNGYPKIGNPISQILNYKKYYRNPDEYIRNRIKCNMGYLFLSINEKGYATLCEERDPMGNILEQDIHDIWFSKRADEVREQIKNCSKNCHQIINCCYEEEH